MRRFQFSLRTLLIVVALLAIPCGWLVMKLRAVQVQSAEDSGNPSDPNLSSAQNDPRIWELQEYGRRRMKRLLTKTGSGLVKLDWDLSTSNKISEVGWPAQESSEEYLLNQDIELSLRLPADLSFDGKANLLICKRTDANSTTLESITLHLPHCTDREAYAIAKSYIQRWKLKKYYSTDSALQSLEEWYKQARTSQGGPGSVNTFLVCRHEDYPIIDLEILYSFDDSRPRFISIEFEVSRPPLPPGTVTCFEAIRTGDAETVCRLLDAGVNPNARSASSDRTLLHDAAQYGRLPLVKELLRRCASVDAKDSAAHRPSWAAVLEGHFDIAECLFKSGAEIDAPSHNGGTILHYVAEYTYGPIPNDELARWLLGHGANVDSVDNQGDTPLHKAAWKGHVAVAEVLLAKGANANARNNDGLTPLDGAKKQNQLEIIKLFSKRAIVAGLGEDR